MDGIVSDEECAIYDKMCIIDDGFTWTYKTMILIVYYAKFL